MLFTPRDRLASFAAAIQSLTDNELLYGLVDYSENEERRSIGCKSTTFAYQREYRFAIGQCSHLSREPLELRSAAGFSSYIKKNSVIRAMDSANGTVLLHLDRSQCSSEIVLPAETKEAVSAT
jgi:hypothetical protein